ncbi:hypothetical protein AB0F88_31610 [Streptosporangium sp. NPDC023963]|uniref:SbtR family transcriptional regulator n=1 Tax=Streptosporangium sp. NPDC023963 TaxID=3155608 RepID=UPI00344627B6
MRLGRGAQGQDLGRAEPLELHGKHDHLSRPESPGAEPDAWTALSGVIRRFAEHQIRAPGLNEALLGSHAAGDAFRDDRQAHAAALDQLVARAHRQRVLRRGTSVADVRVALMAISSLRPTQATRRPDAIRTLLNLLLAGLHSPDHRTAGCSGCAPAPTVSRGS